MFCWRLLRSSAVFLLGAATVLAQRPKVAITVDDLPYAGRVLGPNTEEIVNMRLPGAFKRHHVPVTGFVIGNRVKSPGILSEWTSAGFYLGNHTWSHPHTNILSIEQIEKEILLGERGKRPAFFRFPMNQTGDNKEKHDAIAAFLAQRGYRIATCTIDTSDYVFNNAYVLTVANKDEASARRPACGLPCLYESGDRLLRRPQ
jgi:peptidoglycan/xylan/chitin deacetylase (PgdA/CDA1 family)